MSRDLLLLLFRLSLFSLPVFFCSVPLSAQDSGDVKPKVVIGRFTNETQYGNGVFYDKVEDHMLNQAFEMLSTRLAESGALTLIEGDVAGTQAADYVIVGAITEYSRNNEGYQNFLTWYRIQKVEVTICLRIADADDGSVIYSAEKTGTAESVMSNNYRGGSSGAFDATLDDKAVSSAVSLIVDDILEKGCCHN